MMVDRRMRARGDRGSTMVEASIVVPLLLAVLLGAFTGGVAYNRNNSLRSASADAARYGAIRPVDDMEAWLAAVVDAAKASAAGTLDGSVDGQFICVAYVHPEGRAWADRTSRTTETGGVRGAVEAGPSATCFDDDLGPADRRVQVVVQRTTRLKTMVFDRDVELTSRSVSQFERY